LARQLDPEEVHAATDGPLAHCTHLVQAHQGWVLQYAGDNLLVVFGAHGAEEDIAERALRAGLALLEEVRRLGAQLLLGGGVDGEGSFRGIAVNIAA
jgi:class 3 adenylate cyclase